WTCVSGCLTPRMQTVPIDLSLGPPRELRRGQNVGGLGLRVRNERLGVPDARHEYDARCELVCPGRENLRRDERGE
ncbi:unnamed protein product, partial [Mycena citricolor]